MAGPEAEARARSWRRTYVLVLLHACFWIAVLWFLTRWNLGAGA